MNHTITRGVLAALITGTLLLTACEDTTPAAKDFASVDMVTANVATDGLAAHLLSTVPFEDPNIVQMEAEIAKSLYNVADVATEIVSYGSTGASAEAVLVLRCATEEDAAKAIVRVDTYRSEMSDIYADYDEPESAKLKMAFLAQDGVYVVYCVTPHPEAAENAYHGYVVEQVYGAVG